jgi:predicted anti-sigma-YlaC factor YlaD
MPGAALDDHLTVCADCARWVEDAVRVTRLTRMGSAEVPDLSAPILHAVRLPTRRIWRPRQWFSRRREWLRAGLAVLGLAQLAVAAPAFVGDSVGMAMPMHASHESAAWNLALGVAFLAAASRPRRAVGLVPVLAAFVGALLLLSIQDLASGAVAAGRLLTHLGAVAGLGLVIALDRMDRIPPPDQLALDDADETDRPGRLRTVA